MCDERDPPPHEDSEDGGHRPPGGHTRRGDARADHLRTLARYRHSVIDARVSAPRPTPRRGASHKPAPAETPPRAVSISRYEPCQCTLIFERSYRSALVLFFLFARAELKDRSARRTSTLSPTSTLHIHGQHVSAACADTDQLQPISHRGSSCSSTVGKEPGFDSWRGVGEI